MFRRIAIAALLAGGIVLGSTGTTFAADNQGSGIEITLGGSGSSDKEFDNFAFNGTGSIGFFLLPWAEVGVRQSIGWVQGDEDDLWNGATRGFADIQFNLGRVAPFIGANLGYQYGDGVADTGIAGPEAGIKFYFGENADVFIYFLAEYFFYFEDSDDIDDAFEDGSMAYSLGIGWRI